MSVIVVSSVVESSFQVVILQIFCCGFCLFCSFLCVGPLCHSNNYVINVPIYFLVVSMTFNSVYISVNFSFHVFTSLRQLCCILHKHKPSNSLIVFVNIYCV